MLKKLIAVFAIVSLFAIESKAQDNLPQKDINHNIRSWIGVFGTYRFNDKWGITGDLLTQRNNFVSDLGWYWIRVGGVRWFNDNVAFTGAYAQLWQYTPQLDNKKFIVEHRSDHQITANSRLFNFFVAQRFRLDLRWRENIVDNSAIGHNFTVRPRYLYSFRLPISQNPQIPNLVFANEVLIQFGRSVVYNTFDQIRVFAGIHHTLGNGWSYDFGYFQIYQQRAVGNVYDANHMMRLLVYFSGRKSKPVDYSFILEESE